MYSINFVGSDTYENGGKEKCILEPQIQPASYVRFFCCFFDAPCIAVHNNIGGENLAALLHLCRHFAGGRRRMPGFCVHLPSPFCESGISYVTENSAPIDRSMKQPPEPVGTIATVTATQNMRMLQDFLQQIYLHVYSQLAGFFPPPSSSAAI